MVVGEKNIHNIRIVCYFSIFIFLRQILKQQCVVTMGDRVAVVGWGGVSCGNGKGYFFVKRPPFACTTFGSVTVPRQWVSSEYAYRERKTTQ